MLQGQEAPCHALRAADEKREFSTLEARAITFFMREFTLEGNESVGCYRGSARPWCCQSLRCERAPARSSVSWMAGDNRGGGSDKRPNCPERGWRVHREEARARHGRAGWPLIITRPSDNLFLSVRFALVCAFPTARSFFPARRGFLIGLLASSSTRSGYARIRITRSISHPRCQLLSDNLFVFFFFFSFSLIFFSIRETHGTTRLRQGAKNPL